MLHITIIASDDTLDFSATDTSHSFESAEEMFGKIQRSYARRVEMELRDKTDF